MSLTYASACVVFVASVLLCRHGPVIAWKHFVCHMQKCLAVYGNVLCTKKENMFKGKETVVCVCGGGEGGGGGEGVMP